MSLPGLLIEYLFSGAIALVWLWQFIPIDWSSLQAWHAPFVGILMYVLGMAVDLVAFALLRPVKARVRAWLSKRTGFAPAWHKGSSLDRLVFIQKTSSVVAAEVCARSSRDRIARGIVVNAVIALWVGVPQVSRMVVLAIALGALILWLFSESASHLYELRAAKVLGYEPPPDAG